MAITPLATLLLAVSLMALLPARARAEPLTAAKADGVEDAVVSEPLVTLLDIVANSPDHKVLAAVAGDKEYLAPLADEKERLTLFAPTDAAFARLASRFADEDVAADDVEGIIAAVAAGFGELSGRGHKSLDSTLRYHGVGLGAFSYQELLARKSRQIRTLEPKAYIKFTEEGVTDWDKDNAVSVVTTANILAANGWLHVIDDVLVPFNLQQILDKKFPDSTPPPKPVTPETPETPETPTPAAPTPTPEVEKPAPKKESPTPSVTPETETETPPTPTPGTTDEAGASPTTEGDDDDDDGVCFPATARVHVADGSTVAMADLAAGASVRHSEAIGDTSPIFLFTHRTAQHAGRFLTIATACRHAVTLTRNHYLYANGKLVAADKVRVGDVLRTVDGACSVERISDVRGVGLYAPHSMHGDLVVDGIVVSGYSRAVSPRVAHALLFPVRFFARVAGVAEPLGRAFYEGGDWALRFLPRGNDVY